MRKESVVRAELDTILIPAKELADIEDRALTDEETASFDALMAESDTLKAELKDIRSVTRRQVDISEVRGWMQETADEIIAPVPVDNRASGDSHEAHTIEIPPCMGPLTAFKGPNAQRNAYDAGMWFLSGIATGPMQKRAVQYCQTHGLTDMRAQSETVNTAGGFLVPSPLADAVIVLQNDYGVFRRLARNWPMTADTLDIPRAVGGVTANWIDENGSLTESDQAWDRVTLTAKKLGVLTRVSSELNEDSIINVMDFLAMQIARATALKEDQSGFVGDGTSTYRGIVGINVKMIDGTHTKSAQELTATHDLMSEVDQVDIELVVGQLPEFVRQSGRPAFITSSFGWANMFERLASSVGGTTMSERQGGSSGRVYMGYPVEISEVMPAVGTSLDAVVMFLFGDLSMAAAIGTKRDLRIETSTERYFEQDQIAIRGIQRVDINVHDLGNTTDAGPVIGAIGNVA